MRGPGWTSSAPLRYARFVLSHLETLEPGDVIVLFELGALGDSIMTLTAMRAVRVAQPHARIIRVHERRMGEFFRGCPYVDELLVFDRRRPRVLAALALLLGLRRSRPLAIANLHTPDFDRPFSLYLRDSLFLALSSARWRCGFVHGAEGRLLTHGVMRSAFGARRIDEEMLEVVRPLGAMADGAVLDYWLEAREYASAERLRVRAARAAAIDPESPYFCVSPFARARTREWRLDAMGRAVTEVARATGLVPVLLGADADRARLWRLAATIEVPWVDLVGPSSVRDAAAILSRAAFAIAVDSGLLHLAALVGTKVVGIYGPGDPRRWHPLPQVEVRVVQAGVSCSPCFMRECEGLRCQEEITCDAVAAAALSLWSDRA